MTKSLIPRAYLIETRSEEFTRSVSGVVFVYQDMHQNGVHSTSLIQPLS